MYGSLHPKYNFELYDCLHPKIFTFIFILTLKLYHVVYDYLYP